ncbi:hypothetical protein MRX96_022211 [Rhipicephalus microplus]
MEERPHFGDLNIVGVALVLDGRVLFAHRGSDIKMRTAKTAFLSVVRLPRPAYQVTKFVTMVDPRVAAIRRHRPSRHTRRPSVSLRSSCIYLL